MNIEVKHIGAHNGYPAAIVELVVSNQGGELTEEITTFNGIVDSGIIENLKRVVEELEEHNQKIKQHDKH